MFQNGFNFKKKGLNLSITVKFQIIYKYNYFLRVIKNSSLDESSIYTRDIFRDTRIVKN